MRFTARRLATGLFLVIAMSNPTTTQAQGTPSSQGFEVGAPFPDLALPSLEDGRPRSLADFRGQKLILHVFASW